MHPKDRAQMMAYMLRSGVKDKVKFASDVARPDPKPRIKEIKLFNEFNKRNPKADGGMLVQPGFDGTRQGYSGEFGPNIRKLTKTDSFEVQVVRGGKGGGKGGQKFYKTFNFDEYGGKAKALKAAKEYRDSIPKIKKATGTIVTDKVLEALKKKRETRIEKSKKNEIRKILNEFIAEGKTSFSNEDVRNLINKDLFDTDKNLRSAVDAVKKEPAFKNLKFIKKPRVRGDYFTDPFVRNTIKENYGKLKQKSLAKLAFPEEPLTTSLNQLEIVLSDMEDKGEIKRFKKGEFSEERLQDFDPSPESEKRAKVAKRRRKKIDILGAKEYEKELFDFKKEVQENLGLKKIKSSGEQSGKPRLFDPIDMGHQSSITQLKALKQKLRPEDLNPQFYRANREGIKKFEGGVKTLEKALDKNFYPEQKKLYKQAQKFINAGKAVPEDLQNKIIKSNEDIQKFIDDTVKKYPLLKDRVNAITIDPINLDVKRGDNIFRQLGVGLVDQDLGNIKINSLDDLTIKANLAEQTLREAVDAGLINEKVGRQRLNKFLNVRPSISKTGTEGFIDLSLFGDIGRGAGSLLKAVPTPLGTAALTAGFGVDPTSAIDRATLATEAAFAPQLVQQAAKFSPAVQKVLNLGLTPAMAARVARIASPLGIASLGAEGLYQAGKFTKKRMDELKAMSPEQRQQLRAEQSALAFQGARDGGLIGKKSGPPPISGPTPHGDEGVPGIFKRAKKG